jgi:hypothetical protein
MDHFAGQPMDDFPSQQQNEGQTWPPSDYNYMHHCPQYHGEGPFNTNPLGAIYVSNIPLMTHPPPTPQQPPQPQFDENGQPIKIRKKPGRKPNPASPALRKAQNRAAQRAFRERKERHLKDLEGTIRQLREQRNSAVKELNQAKSKMDSYRAENWYLKGVVLTLQFVCLHHNIHIPTHSPYLTEEALGEMAKKIPHAIEAYVNAYTRNNINLKPTMAAHFANIANERESPKESTLDDDDNDDRSTKRDTEMIEDDDDNEYDDQEKRRPSDATSLSPRSPSFIKIEEEDDETMTQWLKQHNENKKRREQEALEKRDETEEDDKQPNPSSISAIQRIRLQLRLQSTISNIGDSAARLQPTILQLAIPHDPRIDLIPTPHMRDRMIIFRDQMDYDRCFALLINGALYHGGDPTMSASWELPPEFFTEFWYLAINYDMNRTNAWRRLKGLPEISDPQDWHNPQLPSNVYHQSNMSPSSSSGDGTVWTDDVFAQMTAGMPTLQPLDSNHLSSGFDFGSPANLMMEQPFLLHRAGANLNEVSEEAHAMFEQLMASSPDSRHQRSPSIGKKINYGNGPIFIT